MSPADAARNEQWSPSAIPILIAAWHMITSDTEYRDLGGDYFIERTGKTRFTQRLVAQLSQLGWRVNLIPAVA